MERDKTSGCADCGKSFSKRSNLTRHMVEVHKRNKKGVAMLGQGVSDKFLCALCGRQYIRKQDLQFHIDTVHVSESDDSNLKQCPKCLYSTPYKNSLKRHITNVHNKKTNHETLKCADCEKTFNKQSKLASHIRALHKNNSEEDTIQDQDFKIKNLTCTACDRQYARKQNLLRHMNTVHLPLSDDSLLNKCPKCSYCTRYKHALKRHLSNMHTIEKTNRAKQKCSYCTRTFSHKRTLSYHVKKLHPTTVQSKSVLRRVCSLCSKVLYGFSLEVMYSHFENEHSIPMKWETHSFTSLIEFEDWKKFVEKETTSSYIFSYAYKSTTVYKCHRSGVYTKSVHKKRETKMVGSCKINNICPSVMKVNVEGNNVSVKYLPSHVGHKNELKHIRLSPHERNFIAIQLAQKIPHETILNNIRSSVTNGDLQRIHLLTKKDLFNIEQSLSSNEEAIKHLFDDIRVEENVAELQSSIDTEIVECDSRTDYHNQDLESKKKVTLDKMEKCVMTKVTSKDQFQYCTTVLREVDVTLDTLNAASARLVELPSPGPSIQPNQKKDTTEKC